MFYTLVFHVLGRVLDKSRGRFGVLKYTHFVLKLIYNNHISTKKEIIADIFWDSNAYILTTGSFSVYFHFSERCIFMTPSH